MKALLQHAYDLQARAAAAPVAGYPEVARGLLALAAEARRTWHYPELRQIGQVMREVRRARDLALLERTQAALKLKRAPQGVLRDDLTRWYLCASGQFGLLPDSPAEVARLRGTWERTGRAVGVNRPQFGPAWAPPAPPAAGVLHAPEPGTGTPEPGSPHLVRALRGTRTRSCRPAPGQLHPEFEHYVVLGASTWAAAQREYWRHVANRACLAVLADHRLPAVPPRPPGPSSAPPSSPARPVVGGNVFFVQVEAVQLTVAGVPSQTQPLALEMAVDPDRLSVPARLSLASLRESRTPQTVDPLFKYRARRCAFERREGLSGDVITLFEELLRPHAGELLAALGLRPLD